MHYVVKAEYRNSERDDILSKAIELNKNNPKVWIELLSIFIKVDFSEMIFKVFQDGVKSLESDAMPLWQMMETYLILHDENMV